MMTKTKRSFTECMKYELAIKYTSGKVERIHANLSLLN